jgi:hypothetical protein
VCEDRTLLHAMCLSRDVDALRSRSRLMVAGGTVLSNVSCAAFRALKLATCKNRGLSCMSYSLPQIVIWDAFQGPSVLLRISRHVATTHKLAWSRDCSLLVSVGDDRFVKLWNVDISAARDAAATAEGDNCSPLLTPLGDALLPSYACSIHLSTLSPRLSLPHPFVCLHSNRRSSYGTVAEASMVRVWAPMSHLGRDVCRARRSAVRRHCIGGRDGAAVGRAQRRGGRGVLARAPRQTRVVPLRL